MYETNFDSRADREKTDSDILSAKVVERIWIICTFFYICGY